MPGQMAQDVVGSHRDLADVVTVVDAKETPFFSMVPKDRQVYSNLLMEWPVDENEEPTENAVVEAKDVTEFDNALDKYAVLQGRMQWFRRSAMVGKLAQDVQNQAGIRDKKAKAVAKKIIQLKRDIEGRLCGDGDVVVGTGSVANKTRGVGSWINNSAQGVYPVPADYRPPAASIESTATASLTEANVQDVLESQYKQSGRKKTYSLICGTTLKKVFRDFQQTQFSDTNVASAIRVYNQDSASRKIVATVDTYEGDFGTYELIPSLWLAYWDANGATQAAVTGARGYSLDMFMWAIRNKQRIQARDLPDLGGGPRCLIDAICGLVCWNPLGEAKFNATS